MGALLLTAAFLASPLVLRCEWRLALAVPLSVLQLYPPVISFAGYHPPIALLGALSLWPEGLARLKTVLRWPPTACLVALAVLFIASLAWSTDIRLAGRTIVYLGAFLAIFAGVVTVEYKCSNAIGRLLDATIVLGLIEALLVVAFRVAPALEIAFWHTGIAHVTMNPNHLAHIFANGGGNARETYKAGAFFTNGNTAAAYLWILAMTALGRAGLQGGLWRYAASGLFLAAVIMTGSKAAFLMGIALGGTVLILAAFDTYKHAVWSITGLVIVTAGLVGPFLAPSAAQTVSQWVSSHKVQSRPSVPTQTTSTRNNSLWVSSHKVQSRPSVPTQTTSTRNNSLAKGSLSSLQIRIKIWKFGIQQIPNSPWLGLGFGGWEGLFSPYANTVDIKSTLPPHNTLLQLWARAGLFATTLGLVFIVSVAAFGIRWYFGYNQGRHRTVALTALAALAWTFIQGMGTNFGLTGEAHMAPLLAALLGLVYVLSCRDRAANCTDSNNDQLSLRHSRPTSLTEVS